jgi:transcriptional regulator with XRE-family HTH domain
MNAGKDGWGQVAELVAQRFAELSLSKAQFIERSGVSSHTINAVLRGEPVQRADKRGDIAAALGWSRDSIDRILAGGPPILTSPSAADERARLDAIDGRLGRIEELLGQLVGEPRARR